MPLVRIDVIKGQRSPDELRRLADVVQQVLLDNFDAPPGDRYQVSSADAVFKAVVVGLLRLLWTCRHLSTNTPLTTTH